MPKVVETEAKPTMSQRSFASAEFAMKKKRTRREKFLSDMECVVLWTRLIGVSEPIFPKRVRVGRQPMGVSKMLRMYLLQQWYGLADEASEDAIYDSQALRDFVGFDLFRESVPDATTLLKLRRLLETGELTKKLFDEINTHLRQQGLLMRAGTIVNATFLAAPSSTKNASGKRAAVMLQTKKGNQWHYGMKAHIVVDAESGLVHSSVSRAVNVDEATQAGALLHGQETDAFGNSGYRGVGKREAVQGPQWHVAMQPGKRKILGDTTLGQMIEKVEKIKASIRAKVERPFHVIKKLFRHKKTHYRGLDMNNAQLCSLFGLANLVMAKKRLFATHGAVAS